MGAATSDLLGYSVSNAGDVNHDGVDDVIVGAFLADQSGLSNVGHSYVIFGRNVTVAAGNAFGDIQLNTTAVAPDVGFRMIGVGDGDQSGLSVSAAGDVNGDGVDDVIIGAILADPPTLAVDSNTGISYVIFGRNVPGGAAPFIDILLSSIVTGSTIGFRILGAVAADISGISVSSAGDVNDDGLSDIIVGAYRADAAINRMESGISYVIYRRKSINGAVVFNDINLALITSHSPIGFRILGAAANDSSGYSVSAAGDINGDTIDDIVVGTEHGSSYVIYGTPKSPTSQPSSQPSRQPTSQPTQQPSAQPTRQPSLQPSTQPVGLPSASPTSQPSSKPTSQPSL